MKKREGVFLINPKKEINNNGGTDKTKTPSSTDPRYADSHIRSPKHSDFKNIFHNTGNTIITTSQQ